MTTNASSSPCSADQAFWRGCGELRRVDPVRDHVDPRRSSALLLEPQLHRLADRDHAVGAPEVERDEPPQRAHDERVLQPLERSAISGKTSWLMTSSGTPNRRATSEPDVADDRRVGHAEDEVGPLAAERRQHGVAEVAGVVRRAQVELRALVGRRAHADDPHAVPHLLGGQVVPVQVARDDRDVVVVGERLAELGRAAAPSPRRPASSTG